MEIIEAVSKEKIEAICALTAELVKIRQSECSNLAVENIGPEIFGKLLREYLDSMPPLPVISEIDHEQLENL